MADKARFPLRRFDVFAEYERVRNEAHGMPENLAKGRGIWAAKVVAGRRYGSVPKGEPSEGREGKERETPEEEEGFRSIGGVPQTDATFDREIVARMGTEFYHEVFHPAVERAYREGKRYEDIRDSLRKELSG